MSIEAIIASALGQEPASPAPEVEPEKPLLEQLPEAYQAEAAAVSGGEPAVVEGVGVEAPGGGTCTGGVLDVEPEGWRLYSAAVLL